MGEFVKKTTEEEPCELRNNRVDLGRIRVYWDSICGKPDIVAKETYSEDEVDDLIADVNNDLTSHTSDKNNPHQIDENDVLPAQTGNNDKYLKTDGSSSYWAEVSGTSGVTDHSALTSLDYASSGHTGFSPDTHNHNLADLTEHSYNSLTDKPSIPARHSDLTDDEATKHRLINDSGTSNIELWSADKIGNELSGKASSTDLTNHTSNVSNPHSVTASQVGSYTTSQTDTLLTGKEDTFSKNTAFNKNFGTGASDVCVGNDSRLSDARTPTAHTHTASDVTDFDTEVSNNTDVDANTTHRGSTSNPHSVTYSQVGAAASSHTHDSRYYTETEINTWRNSTTQTEMGYVHGVTSDIQTQINGKAASSHNHTASDVTDFDTEVSNNSSVSSNTSHRSDTSNPHSVTYSQVGAAASSHTHTESDITDLDHDAVKLQGRNISTDAPADGQSLVWDNGNSVWKPVTVSGSGGTGTSDHGSLTGLGDDDHTQYHNDTRGDARYYTQTQADANYEPKNSNIQTHISSTSNPHSVTYSQVGAAASSHTHDDRYYTETESDANFEPKNSNIQTHISSTSNPHSVTATQVGAAASSHTHTASNITDFDTEVGNNTDVSANTTHRGKTDNPHSVTYSQVGAAASSHSHTESDITDLDHDAVKIQSRNVDSTAPTDGQALVWDNANSKWTPGTVAGSSPLTTKGDLYTYSTTDARLPVGTDGYILTADSTQATGMKWAAASSSGGDPISGATDNAIVRADGSTALQDSGITIDDSDVMTLASGTQIKCEAGSALTIPTQEPDTLSNGMVWIA